MNLLTGNVLMAEDDENFASTQLTLIEEYRRLVPQTRPGRVALGRVIVPFDSADAKTRSKYRDYAASRYERTLKPQGEARTMFAPDLVGTADQILEQLAADPAVGAVSELRLELPYEFHPQRLRADLVRRTAPHRAGARLAPRGQRGIEVCLNSLRSGQPSRSTTRFTARIEAAGSAPSVDRSMSRTKTA